MAAGFPCVFMVFVMNFIRLNFMFYCPMTENYVFLFCFSCQDNSFQFSSN